MKLTVSAKKMTEKKPSDTQTRLTTMTIDSAGDAINRLLPPEVFLSVLSWLDPPGLKAAVLVCKVNPRKSSFLDSCLPHVTSAAGAQNL